MFKWIFSAILTQISALAASVAALHADQNTLSRKVDKIMALADDLKAGIAKLDTETNENAAQLDAVQQNITQLAGRITNGMTDQEVADVKAALGVQSDKLTAESARLKTLAQDPTNPVPPPPPQLQQVRSRK